MKILKKILFISLILILFSCSRTKKCNNIDNIEFNADSAFSYIEKQTLFGPRVPNTPAHDSCAIFLTNKLKQFGADIVVQNTQVTKFNGNKLDISNIIGQYNLSAERRILLFAHWDSRFFADMEQDSSKIFNPIDGANDGASGVGVLLEIARQFSLTAPTIGVDIAFFDAEDQGHPLYLDIYQEKAWCLGAQYWTKNPHIDNYNAICGISLDMVGKKNATFMQEDFSRYYNSTLVKQIWEIAELLGYQKYFSRNFTRPILHDHVFISQNAGIRSIMIIDNNENKVPYFNEWHTCADNISIIDKNTLEAVGKTVLAFIYCQE